MGNLKYNIAENNLKYNIAENVEIDISPLLDDIIFIKILTYSDAYDTKPKIQEILVDTKNQYCAIGNTCNMLVKLATERSNK